MSGISTALRALAIPVLIGGLASGCAAGRSVVDINVPKVTAPETGPAVKIVDVRDVRQFAVNPKDPSKPSIGDSKEIQDPKITSHAIGRKRGGYGNAMGDLALPDDKTVANVIGNAVKTASHRRGYRVAEEGAPDYGTALPISVGVQQFWIWMPFDGWNMLVPLVRFRMESQVTLSGKDVVGDEPVVVTGRSSAQPSETAMNWEGILDPVIRSGIDDLIDKIEQQLKVPPGVASTPSGSSVAKADAES